jgi:hypothetical protein
MQKEDSILIMVGHLFESMKNSVENCDQERVLNTTTNLAINLDRAIFNAGESNNSELQRKLIDMDNDMSKLKETFSVKCKCTNK